MRLQLQKRLSFVWLMAMSAANMAFAELLVYEPFDYEPVNDEVKGRLEGKDGGIGFGGPWQDIGGKNNEGYAFVYDQRGNREGLYDGEAPGGQPDWDGVVDNLPTKGGYVGMSGWSGTAANGLLIKINSRRKLAQSAGLMAQKNGGVLWMSAVWHFPAQTNYAPVGLALTTGGGFDDRAVGLTDGADGIGLGNGKQFSSGLKRLNAMCWKGGVDVSRAAGAFLGLKNDNIVIVKFEFGQSDKVSTWFFTENQKLSEEAFDQQAVICSTSIDENQLNTLTFGTILRANAVDEIRIGKDFESVIRGEAGPPAKPRQDVVITRSLYDEKSDRYFVEWTSNPEDLYDVYVVEMDGSRTPLGTSVEAESEKERTSFGPFANPRPGNKNLTFEIRMSGEIPDLVSETPAASNNPVEETSERSHAWDNNSNGVRVFILAGGSNMVGHSRYKPRRTEPEDLKGTLQASASSQPSNRAPRNLSSACMPSNTKGAGIVTRGPFPRKPAACSTTPTAGICKMTGSPCSPRRTNPATGS